MLKCSGLEFKASFPVAKEIQNLGLAQSPPGIKVLFTHFDMVRDFLAPVY
jgi:hypothetical protein